MKPRIKFLPSRHGDWFCASKGRLGFGTTPKGAYEEWLKIERKAAKTYGR
jgi:hypothetical protein